MLDGTFAPSAGPSGLHVANVRLDLGGQCVVRDVSFRVDPGEVLAIVGPNGAGKTSLLDAIVGLRRASGDVRFAGVPLSTFSDRARVFSYAPDEPAPPTELRVEDVVAHARACAGTPAALGDDLARSLRVTPFFHATVATLSRGERKRVALFVALCTTRPVVVLDEPFGAFDPLQLRHVLDVVRGRARSGVSVLVSIHQLADAEKIADRVLLLSRGRAVALGSMDELRTRFDLPRGSLEDIFLQALTNSADAPA